MTLAVDGTLNPKLTNQNLIIIMIIIIIIIIIIITATTTIIPTRFSDIISVNAWLTKFVPLFCSDLHFTSIPVGKKNTFSAYSFEYLVSLLKHSLICAFVFQLTKVL